MLPSNPFRLWKRQRLEGENERLLSLLRECQSAFHDYLYGYTPSGDEKAVRLMGEIDRLNEIDKLAVAAKTDREFVRNAVPTKEGE